MSHTSSQTNSPRPGRSEFGTSPPNLAPNLSFVIPQQQRISSTNVTSAPIDRSHSLNAHTTQRATSATRQPLPHRRLSNHLPTFGRLREFAGAASFASNPPTPAARHVDGFSLPINPPLELPQQHQAPSEGSTDLRRQISEGVLSGGESDSKGHQGKIARFFSRHSSTSSRKKSSQNGSSSNLHELPSNPGSPIVPQVTGSSVFSDEGSRRLSTDVYGAVDQSSSRGSRSYGREDEGRSSEGGGLGINFNTHREGGGSSTGGGSSALSHTHRTVSSTSQDIHGWGRGAARLDSEDEGADSRYRRSSAGGQSSLSSRRGTAETYDLEDDLEFSEDDDEEHGGYGEELMIGRRHGGGFGGSGLVRSERSLDLDSEGGEQEEELREEEEEGQSRRRDEQVQDADELEEEGEEEDEGDQPRRHHLSSQPHSSDQQSPVFDPYSPTTASTFQPLHANRHPPSSMSSGTASTVHPPRLDLNFDSSDETSLISPRFQQGYPPLSPVSPFILPHQLPQQTTTSPVSPTSTSRPPFLTTRSSPVGSIPLSLPQSNVSSPSAYPSSSQSNSPPIPSSTSLSPTSPTSPMSPTSSSSPRYRTYYPSTPPQQTSASLSSQSRESSLTPQASHRQQQHQNQHLNLPTPRPYRARSPLGREAELASSSSSPPPSSRHLPYPLSARNNAHSPANANTPVDEDEADVGGVDDRICRSRQGSSSAGSAGVRRQISRGILDMGDDSSEEEEEQEQAEAEAARRAMDEELGLTVAQGEEDDGLEVSVGRRRL
jgi:hypothetical protein